MKTYHFAAAALLTALSPPAVGQPGRDTATLAVPFDDLDLTGPEGRATLDERLAAAARTVCHTLAVSSPFDLLARARCKRITLASARRKAVLAADEAQRRSLLARNEIAR